MTSKLISDTGKFVKDSLGFLDNIYVRWFLIILVILYITGLAPLFTYDVIRIFQNPLVKLFFLLFILYIAVKDLPLALLLVIAFVVSMHFGYTYQVGAELGKDGAVFKAGVVNTDDGKQFETIDGNVENLVGTEKTGPDGGNYNNYFDCVKECADGDINKGALDTPCKGVGVWKDELNAQGIDCPLGYSGSKVGSPF